MNRIQQWRQAGRDIDASDMVPLTAHVDTHVVVTRQGDYVQTIALAGVGFETNDDASINQWHERLNMLWRNLASSHLSMWVHVVRSPVSTELPAHEAPQFATDLDQRYMASLADRGLLANRLYLTLVYRPLPTAAGGLARHLMRSMKGPESDAGLPEALDFCAKLRDQAIAALDIYTPQPLGIYTHGEDERHFSSLLEFYGVLVNGEWHRMPLPTAPAHDMIAVTRPFFGTEVMEYRGATQSQLGAFLGIKEYPTPTVPGMLGALLAAPFPFVLTQSFTFLSKAAATELMQRQSNRMGAANDRAVSQAQELELAQDALASNQFVVGDHHFSLQVLAPSDVDAANADPRKQLQMLQDRVALARQLLAETGMVVAREDLAMEAAFWAQLPGNFGFRPRKAPITSRNFAALSPFHNHLMGQRDGNHWGPALAAFATRAGTPYYYSLHGDELGSGGRTDVGHTVGIGPVGSGKTTLLGFCMASLTARSNPTQIVFDKDEGLHILVRAMGGNYLTLKNGVPTGCNPLQLDSDVPAHLEFLRQWLYRLVLRQPDERLSAMQRQELNVALLGVLSLEPEYRRLGRLCDFLDVTDPDGLYARLQPWCNDGPYAWVFDNAKDEIAAQLGAARLIGFDVTDFLANPAIRTPITMYLFHLVGQLVDGRPLVCWMDEFARLLDDPAFAAFARNGLETWRKRNAALVAFTQSASQILESTIARAIVEQTPTKLLMPNGDADPTEYIEGLHTTEREFELVRQEMSPSDHQFLVKRGQASVVCELDLHTCPSAVQVISGRSRSVALMQQLIAEHGSAPEQWLPHFQTAALRFSTTAHPRSEAHRAH